MPGLIRHPENLQLKWIPDLTRGSSGMTCTDFYENIAVVLTIVGIVENTNADTIPPVTC